jgi:HEPN domain-containing protein
VENVKELANQTILWIDIALSDLQSSKILYVSKEYRTSYFQFQQASEKANKSLALFGLDMNAEDLKRLSHNQIKIYKKPLIDQQNKIQKILETFELFPKVKNHPLTQTFRFQEAERILEKANTYVNDLLGKKSLDITTKEIHTMLDELYELEDQKFTIPQKLDLQFIETMRTSIDWIGHFEIPEAHALQRELQDFFDNEKNIQMVYDWLKIMMQFNKTFSFILASFTTCAYFTTKHNESTRYPIDGNNPLKIYTKKLPMIRDQEEIMDVLERALKKFRRFITTNIKVCQ